MCFKKLFIRLFFINTYVYSLFVCSGSGSGGSSGGGDGDGAAGRTTIPDMLVWLMGRDRPIEIQLGAARCITYLHRSDAIEANDSRLVFRTLPCLVRLCQKEHEISHRFENYSFIEKKIRIDN